MSEGPRESKCPTFILPSTLTFNAVVVAARASEKAWPPGLPAKLLTILTATREEAGQGGNMRQVGTKGVQRNRSCLFLCVFLSQQQSPRPCRWALFWLSLFLLLRLLPVRPGYSPARCGGGGVGDSQDGISLRPRCPKTDVRPCFSLVLLLLPTDVVLLQGKRCGPR